MISVNAKWDNETGMWFVERSSVPGLHVEGGDSDSMREEILAGIEGLVGTRPTHYHICWVK